AAHARAGADAVGHADLDVLDCGDARPPPPPLAHDLLLGSAAGRSDRRHLGAGPHLPLGIDGRESPGPDRLHRVPAPDAEDDARRMDRGAAVSPLLRQGRAVANRGGPAGPRSIHPTGTSLPCVPTDAARVPCASLPALVAGTSHQGEVTVAYQGARLALTYQGPSFPPFPTDSAVYGVLVVDDSTQRAQGMLIYESVRPPPSFPQLGTVRGGGTDKTIPLYGVDRKITRLNSSHGTIS